MGDDESIVISQTKVARSDMNDRLDGIRRSQAQFMEIGEAQKFVSISWLTERWDVSTSHSRNPANVGPCRIGSGSTPSAGVR